jgi:hypothetical protein
MPITLYNGSFTQFNGSFIIGSLPSLTAITQTFTTTGFTNFTVPDGVTSIYAVLVGGGGGGAGSDGTRNEGNGGGGGGALAYGTIFTSPGQILKMFVGAGGNAGTIGGGNGGAGGTTYISSSAGILIQAGGGAGGQNRSTVAVAGGVSTGFSRVGGGNGGAGGGATDNNQGGGGGGAGGYSGNGGAGGGTGAGSNGSGGGGGGGGSTNSGQGYGGGGVGISTEGANGTGGAQNAIGTGGSGGVDGTRPAGGLYGGGGGACDDDTNGAGGAGAQGVIYLSYTNTSPNIITTNLTHWYDAGNASSYTGSGNIWTNLVTSTGVNMYLTGSPSFVSNNTSSYFVFNGVNQFASSSNFRAGGDRAFTLNMVCNFAPIPSGFANYRFWSDNGNPTSFRVARQSDTTKITNFDFSQGATNFFGSITGDQAAGVISASRDYMLTFVSDATNIDLYINGTFYASSTEPFTAGTATGGGAFWFATSANGGTPLSMSIANILWYSSSLSAADIAQNYSVLKSRYSLP